MEFSDGGLYGLRDDGSSKFKNLKSMKPMDFEDKQTLHRYHMLKMINQTSQMFSWEGLPETIPQRTLELNIQRFGFSVVFKKSNQLYTSFGSLGGGFNYNYMPSKAIIANPYLEYYEKLSIDKDCIVIPNDTLYLGMIPIHNYYATKLVENDVSLNCLLINTRAMNLLIANDDDAYKDLNEVIDDLKNGKIRSVLAKNLMSEGIKSTPFGSSQSSQTIIQLLEERQYTYGHWWNEVGVQSNYNMKRETITSNENILNVDSLLPLADDFLKQRKIACEKINKMFGVNWSVDYSSAWKKIRTEIKVKEELNEAEAINAKNPSNQLDNKNLSNQLDKGSEDNENKDK